MSKTKSFLDFYLGQSPNENGMTIEQIFTFSEEELEIHHNFIQWLFPMTVPSSVCPEAPLATPEIISAFKENHLLQNQLLRATKVMLAHYGLKLSGDQVLMGDDFPIKKQNISGHNLLRISRILKSLVTLGKRELSHGIFVCLSNLVHVEMPELQSTVDSYWRAASKP